MNVILSSCILMSVGKVGAFIFQSMWMSMIDILFRYHLTITIYLEFLFFSKVMRVPGLLKKDMLAIISHKIVEPFGCIHSIKEQSITAQMAERQTGWRGRRTMVCCKLPVKTENGTPSVKSGEMVKSGLDNYEYLFF